MDKIPYHKPMELSRLDKEDITNKIKECLTTGQLTNGKHVQELERQVKEMYDAEFCIATSNCTMGLMLCYQYFNNLTCGAKIHMPNFTWISPHLIAMESGFKQIFHDIDPKTWLMKGESPHTELVSPCHTFGNIVECEEDYRVVYDGAHALGSKIKKIGDATVFSLAPTKMVTSCEGGLIITNQKYLADHVRFRRDKCARMSEIHAIIGLQTLKHLEDILEWKRKVYDYYKEHVLGIFQEIPIESNYNTIGFLNENNLIIPEYIETKSYYEPVYQKDLFPNAWEVYKKIICLPSYYGVDYKEIVRSINEANY